MALYSAKRHVRVRGSWPVDRTYAPSPITGAWSQRTPTISVTTGSGDTIYANSPSYADVTYAINEASPGDTVMVPAGSATWASSLSLSKGIVLKGAGIGQTIITRGGTTILSYVPSNYALNSPFRLSGFSFNGAGGHVMYLGASYVDPSNPWQTKIRVDHNRFYTNTSNMDYQAITYRGPMAGSVDNNTFDTWAYPMRNTNCAWGAAWWNAWNGLDGYRFHYADQYNIYFEDNIYNMGSSTYNCVTDSAYSGRYTFRYNTVDIHGDGQTLMDLHGNWNDGSMYSSFGAELYGNLFKTNGYSGYIEAQRGAKMMMFYNAINGGDGRYRTKLWEDYDESISPTTSPDHQDINDSYYFQNRFDSTGSKLPITEDEQAGDKPLINRDYFSDETSQGPAGCGSGALANRPASGTYVNQGYWATDQSTTNLTSYVGEIQTYPTRQTISGTLYIWNGATWESHYVPYAYPHPLRSDPVVGD